MMDLTSLKQAVKEKDPICSFGEVASITEQLIVSKGPICKIGDVCTVGSGERAILCEVIRTDQERVYLVPLADFDAVMIKDRVSITQSRIELPPMDRLLGRTIDATGQWMDDLDPMMRVAKEAVPLVRKPPRALSRKRITDVLPTGIKAIDSLLTLGKGQRIGIFAGTGVGKSTLLGMTARYAEADVNVIALIGERGREVREFIENELGEEGMKKSVLIVSTSDEKPLMNIKAAQLATSIAESFRDQGKDVLLMMDSVTRYAMARREIDAAMGLPIIQGKSPSMEPYLQSLLERAGTSDKGTITGIYSVLVEGDDMQGAIPDMVRGILDGHIVLDRKIAAVNQFPAIDVLSSVSRVMDKIVTDEHWQMAREAKKHLSVYKENEDSLLIGTYERGRNNEVDLAVLVQPKLMSFLKQDIGEHASFEQSVSALEEILT